MERESVAETLEVSSRLPHETVVSATRMNSECVSLKIQHLTLITISPVCISTQIIKK